MLSRIFVLLFAVAFIFAGSTSIRAQNPQNEWGRVERVSAKTSVIVQTKDGRTISGKVESVGPSSITVRHGRDRSSIAANSVQSIYRARSGSRLKRAVYGGLIGGLAGVAALGIYTVAAKADPLTAAGGVLFGVPLGAVIGAASGGKKSRAELIYIAP